MKPPNLRGTYVESKYKKVDDFLNMGKNNGLPSIQENDPWLPVAEAFGRKAQIYDSFGQNHPNLARMRLKVRTHFESLLPPGARLLEINAGTGADAAYFAARGYRVHATDLSPGMLAQIQEKILIDDLSGRLSAQQVSFTDLEQVKCGPFDGLLSNFGGVNCASDLTRITRSLPALLKPGGVVTWVVMPPICLWELAKLLRGKLHLALRRLTPGGIQANVEGLPVPTYYYTALQVRKAFGPDFLSLHLEGLSVFTPPADHKEFPSHHPNLYRWLVLLDERLSGRFPFRSWGDFYILSLRYTPQSPVTVE
jgi:SAM-dependent methyltransferase